MTRPSKASGFTLVEVLIAMALFVTIATGVAQLAAIATRAVRASRDHSAAVVLAAAKMDQLRALEWSYERAPPGDPPVPRTDRSTDSSTAVISSTGSGLDPSPPGSLTANTPPYVDYLDGAGRWVGNGTSPPLTTVFVRRWSIRPLPADPDRTLVIQVLVTTMGQEKTRVGPWSGRTGVEALLATARTRKIE